MKYFNLAFVVVAACTLTIVCGESNASNATDGMTLNNATDGTSLRNATAPRNATIDSFATMEQEGPSGCRRLNLNNIDIARPYGVITVIDRPFGAVASGNDVYISGNSNGDIFHFNSQEDNGTEPIETNSIDGNPTFLDIYDDYVYVTSSTGNGVYRKPLSGGSFNKILRQDYPIGIKWSADGERLLVSKPNDVGGGTVYVYNSNLEQIDIFNTCPLYPQEISFDLDGNIRISAFNDQFCIYDGNSYNLIRRVTIEGTSFTEGYLQHCDGTIILADRGISLLFLDKDYNNIGSIPGFGSIADVALTADGILYVTDYYNRVVYLYSLYE